MVVNVDIVLKEVAPGFYLLKLLNYKRTAKSFFPFLPLFLLSLLVFSSLMIILGVSVHFGIWLPEIKHISWRSYFYFQEEYCLI